MQIRNADLILLNKVDLITNQDELQVKIKEINARADIVCTTNSAVAVEKVKNITPGEKVLHPSTPHGMEQFSIESGTVDRKKFEAFLSNLPKTVFRLKGNVVIDHDRYLVNYVAGRWNLSLQPGKGEKIVVIGRNVKQSEEIKESFVKCLI